MSLVHVHLLLNHVPVIGIAFVAILLAIAIFRRSTELSKVAFAFLAALGVVGIIVFLTGEPAEELVENLPGISELGIERHEEAALLATILLAICGAGALVALAVFRRRALPRWTVSALLVATMVVGGFMGFAANLGGQIRHSELRAGATPPSSDISSVLR